ncbi:hypothetical protein JCM3774_005977 [Rhodotorula dairenensis]
MNTIQYFLSTLRPAPPPSARASTSGVRIDNEMPDLARTASSPLHPATAPRVYPSIDVQMRGFADAASVADSGPAGPGRDQRDNVAAISIVDEIDDDEDSSSHSSSSSDENLSPSSSLARNSTRRGGKAPGRPDPAQETLGVAVEDPLRDEASIRTEVERGEGVEVAADASPRGAAGAGKVSRPPPPIYDAATAPAAADLASSTASNQKESTRISSSSWPWISRLARWWPVRVTASMFILLRRFLALFPFFARPGYNAVFAPRHLPQKRLQSPSPSILRPSSGRASDAEKGMRHARVVSLELAVPSPPNAPPSALQRQRARSLSPPSVSAPPATSIPRAPAAPPRLTPKTLVLDLDETLIHSTSRAIGLVGVGGKRGAPKGLKTRVVEVVLDGRSTVYTVYKRPWVDFFLRKVSSWYTVVIFTASLPEYADPVIDWLDGGDGRGGMIGARLFRSDCVARNGSYMKDLSVVEPDLSRVCLVDNSPASYAINQANGIPIEGWINDPNDECLLDLLPMLDSLRFTNDVRRVLGLRGFSKGNSADSLSVPKRARVRSR